MQGKDCIFDITTNTILQFKTGNTNGFILLFLITISKTRMNKKIWTISTLSLLSGSLLANTVIQKPEAEVVLRSTDATVIDLDSDNIGWELQPDVSAFSGQALVALTDDASLKESQAIWTVDFATPGNYMLYLRYLAPSNGNDNFYQLTPQESPASFTTGTSLGLSNIGGVSATGSSYQWIALSQTAEGKITNIDANSFYIKKAGKWDFGIATRGNDFLTVDTIILSQNLSLTPEQLDTLASSGSSTTTASISTPK